MALKGHPLVTSSEIAERLLIDRDTARHLANFLLGARIAKDRGVRRAEGRTGRGENLFEIPDDVVLLVSKILRRL